MDQPTDLTPDEYLASLSPEEQEKLNLEVMAEQKRAGEAIEKMFKQAERGQALKLNVLHTRALAGFVYQLTEQNTHLANLAEVAAQALEESEKKKKKGLWRPKT